MMPTMQLAKRTSNFSMALPRIADCGCCGRVGPVPQNRQDCKKEAAQRFYDTRDGMNETNKSEVARLREQIELEYQATQRVFTDFTATARHEFITKRQENIAACFEELKQLMPPEEAIVILAETLNSLQSSGSLSGSTS
jgi:hypothetical protein